MDPFISLPKNIQDRAELAPNGCWLWTGHLIKTGYGRLGPQLAHRRVYELLIGLIPEGLEIDHLCRVRRCVNPAHMEAVTHQENLARGDFKSNHPNARKTTCPVGHPYDMTTKSGRQCRKCVNAKWMQRWREKKNVSQ